MRKGRLAFVLVACALAVAVVSIAVLKRHPASTTQASKPAPSSEQAAEGDNSEPPGESEGEGQDSEHGRAPERVPTQSAAERKRWERGTRAAPAPGWAGEKELAKTNDWEPATAADPSAPYLYVLTTEGKTRIKLHRSLDDGATWEAGSIPVLLSVAGWQADPQIATDSSGNLYVVGLTAPYTMYFTKSTDHGVTWSDPVDIKGITLPWSDHPWMAVSDDGQDIYVGFNHTGNYQVVSHDSGVTWSDPVASDPTSTRYYFAVGATILPSGTAVFADVTYAVPYGKQAFKHGTEMYAVRSADGGLTWNEVHIASVATAPECTSYKCPKAQYGGQPSVASDTAGKLMYVYSGGTKAGGPQQIWATTSTDDGVTWTPPAAISPKAPVSGYPQVEAAGSGDFRVAWADNRKGTDHFNIYYRATTDGGATWGTEARISNAGGGASYKSPKGFKYFYGDYMDTTITDAGKSFLAWGESPTYAGPGQTWYATQT